jgi:hypothetical protein
MGFFSQGVKGTPNAIGIAGRNARSPNSSGISLSSSDLGKLAEA